MRLGWRGSLAFVLAGIGATGGLLWAVLARRGDSLPAVTGPPDGRALYTTHCAECHGSSGKGDGPGASVVRQPMQDFSDAAAMGKMDDRFLTEIIKKGSSQFGRSNAMPAWGMKLSGEEIQAIVAYIRALARLKPAGPPATHGKEIP